MDKIIAIQKHFKTALKKFYEQDYDSLDFKGSERAKVFRIAHYLANLVENDPLFKGYTVDCEFNRTAFDNKKNYSYIEKIKDSEIKKNHNIMPDLIVHIRTPKNGDHTKNNLLVCEFKNTEDSERDSTKIDAMLKEYHYELGLVINLSKKEENLTDIKFIPLSAVQCEKWL